MKYEMYCDPDYGKRWNLNIVGCGHKWKADIKPEQSFSEIKCPKCGQTQPIGTKCKNRLEL